MLSLGLTAQSTEQVGWWWNYCSPPNELGCDHGIGAGRAQMLIENSSLSPQKVIVAVLDGGTDINHEDLKDVIWINSDEIADNGIDDDGNGYVDDIHGWSLLSGPGGVIGHDNFELVRIERQLMARKNAGEKLSKADKTLLKEVRKARKKRYKVARRNQLQFSGFTRAAVDIKSHCGEDFNYECVGQVKDAGSGLSYKLMCYMVQNNLELGSSSYQVTQRLLAPFDQINHSIDFHLNIEFDPMESIQGPLGDNQVVGNFSEHGTHVAGLIGAIQNNGLGIKGVANNVEIMVLRVVPNGDERDEQVAEAIRYAVDNGASIINMSFGKSHSQNPDIVDEATRYAEAHDVLMVHAAGNESLNLDRDICFPNAMDEMNARRYSHWIEVGASTSSGNPARFSNYGQYVDVFAPGQAIYSTMPGNHYLDNDGTSMAAPVVSGVAAVLRGLFPELTAAQIRDIIMNSAVVIETEVSIPGKRKKKAPFSELTASGIVNLEHAIRLAKTYVPEGSPESEVIDSDVTDEEVDIEETEEVVED